MSRYLAVFAVVVVPGALIIALATCGEETGGAFGPAPVDAGKDAEAASDGDAAPVTDAEAGVASDAADAQADVVADAQPDAPAEAGPPPFLSCDGLAAKHLVVKIVAPADKPSGTRIAMDGWIGYSGQALVDPSWRGLYIASTTDAQAAADLSTQPIGQGGAFIGEVASGTAMEFNPGYNASANLAASPVVDSGYLCQNGACKGSILVCYGATEVGRSVDGTITGKLIISGKTGANISVAVP